MKTPAILVVATVLTPVLLSAQSVARRYDATSYDAFSYDVASWRLGTRGGIWKGGVIHYGKWLLAAGAVSFTILGEREHRRSQRFWNQLLRMCQTDNQSCALGDDGRYLNFGAEVLYEESVYYDHRARNRLLVGQVSLLGAAAMFIADVSRKADKPGNIPFHGMMVAPQGDGLRLGYRIAF